MYTDGDICFHRWETFAIDAVVSFKCESEYLFLVKDFWNMKDRLCLAVLYVPVLLNRTELDEIKSRPGNPGHTVIIKPTNKNPCHSLQPATTATKGTGFTGKNWMLTCKILTLLPNDNYIPLGFFQYFWLLTSQPLN